MRNLIYSILMLLVILATVSCGEEKKNSKDTQKANRTDDLIKITQAQFDQNKMALGTIEQKEFPIIVEATGMIDVPPENRSVVSATMGGYIKTLPLLIGDLVTKGQALLTIENPDFVTLQQQYMEISSQLDYLKSENDRQKTLYEENISSEKSFLKVASDYKSALAKYNGLRKQLLMLNISPTNVEGGNITSVTTIYAPISGSVTKVNLTRGSYVAPATSILEIIDNNHIHLELSVFEKDIMKIEKDQKINFKIPEATSDSYEAEVHLIGTSIGEERTIKVHGHLIKEDKNKFLTGMFVEASIIVDSSEISSLPEEAVVNVGDKNFVLVLERKENGNYYFKQSEVRVMDRYAGYTGIENNTKFKAADQILTKGAFSLLGD
ncbi:efflux RND transporter periplasmic adaptor subunit [Sediminicola arcticus]|uniref:Efflux RND transporter periplasmic adaptor subunit n=1 Tax=Sediminicola arcticus TaxID=1574308 RepID=A0ABV2SXJ6_9FLAO